LLRSVAIRQEFQEFHQILPKLRFWEAYLSQYIEKFCISPRLIHIRLSSGGRRKRGADNWLTAGVKKPR
jgi:hypothetical protein